MSHAILDDESRDLGRRAGGLAVLHRHGGPAIERSATLPAYDSLADRLGGVSINAEARSIDDEDLDALSERQAGESLGSARQHLHELVVRPEELEPKHLVAVDPCAGRRRDQRRPVLRGRRRLCLHAERAEAITSGVSQEPAVADVACDQHALPCCERR